jgi:predicted TPR repeat methyltransferase
LGGGKGRHSLPLSDDAIIVDKKNGQDIREYKLKGRYDIVIANNVLPFLDSKEEVKTIVKDVMSHLKKNGVFIFTVWGPNHVWAGNKLTHLDPEIHNLIKDHFVYFKKEEEGMVTIMNGDKAYWHSHEFWLMKK